RTSHQLFHLIILLQLDLLYLLQLRTSHQLFHLIQILLPPSEHIQNVHENELRVYTRRKRSQEEMENPIQPEQNHESNPILENPGNNSKDTTSYTDPDIPIAIRIGV
ncbi:hypothetical protein TorRG33x02_273970, partial [Trema orientale]